jgi:S-adenosylmethionine-dependent methyltransferase
LEATKENMSATVQGENRFENDASRYAAYLQTPEGRLRTELTLANLVGALPHQNEPLHALDVGGGTGAAAVRLARLGMHVTVLDSSASMLKLAEQTAVASGITDWIRFVQGDAATLDEVFQPRSFDVIVCHNVLEYVDDPQAVLRAAAHVMRNSSSILSVLVRNQAGEVLKAALLANDLAAAENNLSAQWGQESLYGGKVRFFTPGTLDTMLNNASLGTKARQGVRIISDYLPATISRSAEYDAIFALECKLSHRPEFYAIARYLHYLASFEAAALGERE